MTDATATATAGFVSERDGGIVRITIAKPARMNAIDYDAMIALGDAIIAAGQDPSVRVIVLTGEGNKAFCTGADLAATGEAAAAGVTPEMTMDGANRLVRAIVEAPVPVLARVNGAAAGIGASLAIAADITYATEDAYLLLAFINIGLMPDGGASALVGAAAGRAVAAEMALLGDRLSAQSAKAAGLITAVVPADELDAKVEAAALKLAEGPRRAQELTKRAVNAATLAALDGALEREKEGQIELLSSADFIEGVTAMLTKRKPVFGK
ncbi:enoyl-CoA hydratase [Aldersonia sp. NBC_00410]|uniref:enoyl-CoA hydratase n=1 Tax=Aldersonia sp. NBC_00410 TaxID=2975954 RepID=UPI00224CEEC4|nr:enoyl-CoA hydratase [Aldersonia sp. NBC_00410]MCX5044002.1 enoyl-CoA hydratase [Aldersonia sp. NBC_00410]